MSDSMKKWGKIACTASEVGLSLAFPHLSGFVAMEKFGREALTALGTGKESPAKVAALLYVAALGEALKVVETRFREAGLKFKPVEIDVGALLKKYPLRHKGGRSIFYDVANHTAGRLVKAKAMDQLDALLFAQLLVRDWVGWINEYLWSADSVALETVRRSIRHEGDWALYRLKLGELPFRSPALGKEGFPPLSEVYVWPEATMRDIEKNPEQVAKHRAVPLYEKVISTVSQKEKLKPILLLGGPGTGKTCFSMMLVEKLTAEHADMFPVFCRLRVIKSRMENRSWSETFRTIPSLMDGSTELEITREDIQNKKLLFIFDGMDELLLGGGESRARIKDFYEVLDNLLDNQNVRVIITSRSLQYYGDRERLQAMGAVFDYAPIFPGDKLSELISKLKDSAILKAKPKEFKDWIVSLDGEGNEKVGDGRICGQPLLVSFLADLYSEMKGELSGQVSKGEIYEKMVEATLRRTYDKDADALVHLEKIGLKTPEEARRFLAEIALFMYQLGRDHVFPNELKPVFSKMDKHAAENLSGVFLTFHMQEKCTVKDEDEGQSGVEFMHKSFGEFLAADAMVRKLEGLARGYAADPNDDHFAEDFFRLFGPKPVDEDSARYFEYLFAANEKIEKVALKQALKALLIGCLEQKWINTPRILEVTREHAANANKNPVLLTYEAGAAVSASYLLNVALRTASDAMEWGRWRWGRLFHRLECTQVWHWFPFFSAPGAYLEYATLVGADMSYGDLSTAYLFKADLIGANLIGISLRGANIESADLAGAFLAGANLQAADLQGADLTDADFHDANLSDADLRDANFHDADLSGADLKDAKFHDTDLTGADLTGADLHAAKGLNEGQLRRALLGTDTKLPDEFAHLIPKKEERNSSEE